jgi:hypothetical protein
MTEDGDVDEFSPNEVWTMKNAMKKSGNKVNDVVNDIKDTKKPSIMEKTKKNVALEASLFSVVCAGFIFFNVYYWTRPRLY